MSADEANNERIVRGGPLAAPILIVRLAGPPEGKGRLRFRMVKPRGREAFASAYTPARTRHFEARLRDAALRAMGNRPLLEGPLAVTVRAFMVIPASWPRKKRQAALDGDLLPVGKPDADNILKVLDSFNRDKITGLGIWNDDSQVTDARVIKTFAKRVPGLIVEIRRAEKETP